MLLRLWISIILTSSMVCEARRKAFTASVTLVSEPPSTSSPIRKLPIKTGRISVSDDKTETSSILPTPTQTRTSNDFHPQAGGLPLRRGSPSSLAEKRRRFLAHSRRNRPTVPPPGQSSTDPSSLGSSPANPFKSHLISSPDGADRLDLSGIRSEDDDAQSSDQEMAETIEVTPSKVKRFQDLANLSTFFAIPTESGSGERKERGGSGRILVRKLYRRPGGAGGRSENGKNRLTSLRRPNSKNRMTFAGARALASDDEQQKKEQLHQQRLKEVLMAAAASNKEASLTSASINEILPSASSKLVEPTSATIAEYLHETAELGAGSDRKSSIFSSLSSSPGENEADLPSVSDFPELQGSQVEVDGQLTSSPFGGESVLAPSSDGPTAPLPVVKTRRGAIGGGGHGDPGLTVPLQLSIVTSTFSLTETKLQTSLLPVYDGTSTTYYTLTQSFLVTKTVTTFQTVPPKEFMPYLIPGNESYNALNDVFPEMNSGQLPVLQRKSDLQTETENPLANDPEQDTLTEDDLLEKSGSEHLPVDANGAPKNADANSAAATTSNNLNPLNNPAFPGMGQQQQVNPLLGNLPFLNLLGPAALGLNPYFNPYGLGLPQVVTTSRPIFSTDVVFTSKLLPIIDGLATSYHTIREPASTVTHTNYETFTTQVSGGNPFGNNNLNAQMQQQQMGGNGQQQQGVSTVTSPHTFVTTETQTSTQVFKLMYDGYKTSFRTVTSRTEVTRTVTTFSTSTVPVYTQNLLPFFG